MRTAAGFRVVCEVYPHGAKSDEDEPQINEIDWGLGVGAARVRAGQEVWRLRMDGLIVMHTGKDSWQLENPQTGEIVIVRIET